MHEHPQRFRIRHRFVPNVNPTRAPPVPASVCAYGLAPLRQQGARLLRPQAGILDLSSHALGSEASQQSRSFDRGASTHHAVGEHPFVSAYLPRTDPTSPFPTLQVTCRVVARKVEPRSLLQPVLASLRSQFDDLEILESSADAIVAGRPATLVKARFSVHELRVRGSRESRRLCWVGRATKKSLRMSGDSTRLDPLKEFRRLYLEPTAHREMLTPSTAVLDTLSPGERVVAEKELLGELETRVVDQRVLLALGHFRTEAAVPTLQQHLRKSKQDPTNPRRGCPVGHLP
jgi:hypothetical protein